MLKAYGLVKPRRKQPLLTRESHALFAAASEPNDTWCVDFKGHFLLGDGQRCDPLTMSDQFSRYILKCEGLTETGESVVRPHFDRVFREFGLPNRMRSDNGPPFASRSVGGLSTLSVWLLKLGIEIEYTDPGHPEQNGRHERMHRTLKAEVPPRKNLVEEQLALDRCRCVFNEVRPHEALAMKTPATVYHRSRREMPAHLTSPEYPSTMTRKVLDEDGRMRWNGSGHISVSKVLRSEPVGIDRIDDRKGRLYYGTIVLADFVTDEKGSRLVAPEPVIA